MGQKIREVIEGPIAAAAWRARLVELVGDLRILNEKIKIHNAGLKQRQENKARNERWRQLNYVPPMPTVGDIYKEQAATFEEARKRTAYEQKNGIGSYDNRRSDNE